MTSEGGGMGGEFKTLRSDVKESTTSSIPLPHKEHEKYLQQIEAECRFHIKVQQQMKLHQEQQDENIKDLQKEISYLKLKVRDLEAHLEKEKQRHSKEKESLLKDKGSVEEELKHSKNKI